METKNEQNDSVSEPDYQKGEKTGTGFKGLIKFIKTQQLIIAILMGLIAIICVYIWKDTAARKQKAAIIENASIRLMEKNNEMLVLLCKPLTWLTRSEMLRSNLEEISIFTSDLVKEKNFQYIHLIDPAGNVIISTNKKLEGQSAGEIFGQDILSTDSTIVRSGEGNNLIVAAPVMGYDRRLGTLILNYSSEDFRAELNTAEKNN